MADMWGVTIGVSITLLVLTCAMICVRPLTRNVPINYICLLLFTLLESYMVASVCALSDKQVVFCAAFSTGAIVLAITAYAWTTKRDFVILGPMLLIILGLACALSCLFMFAFFFDTVRVLCTILGVVIYSIYLMIDT